jgi:electron transport complex protein RnfC
MSSELLTFPKGGVHPPDSKTLTAHLPIERMPLPKELEVILDQHIGAPEQPLVKRRQKVTEGELIADVGDALGTPVHAPAAGQVMELGQSSHPMRVSARSIKIKTRADAEPREYTPGDWSQLSREELLDKIRRAGVIGEGGAGFPTYAKLSPPPEAKIDTLILNGAECEPYITADQRQMVEHPAEIVEGARIMLKILGVRDCHIGIEANKPDAIAALQKAAKEASTASQRIVVHGLEVKYPQGSEKQLIQSITGRKVPSLGLPASVGVIVQNVSTADAVYDAVVLDKPFYEKVLTFSGRGIARPANLLVKIGTLLSDAVEYLGGIKPELSKIVAGGPMMGFAFSTLDVPITKTTSSVLFLSKDEIDVSPHGPCIRCGWCVEVCPMGCEPNEIGVYVEAGRPEDTFRFGTSDCFECGCCAYVCPSKRPLVQFVRVAKMKLKAKASRRAA